MKKKTSSFSVIVLSIICFFTILNLSSCDPDKCKTRDIKCQNGGTCFDGNCNCASGYEGDSCQTLVTKKFNAGFGGLITYPNRAPFPYRNSDSIYVSQVLLGGNNNLQIQYYSLKTPSVIVLGKVNNNSIAFNGDSTSADGFRYFGTGSLNNDVITLTMHRDSIANGVTFISEVYTFVGTRY